MILISHEFAKLYVDEDKSDTAIICYKKILSQLDPIKDVKTYLVFTAELSWIYFNEGQVDTALSLLRHVITSMEKENIYLSGMYVNYGVMFYNLKDYQLAKYYLLKEDFEKANIFAKGQTAELYNTAHFSNRLLS
ncbi:MAG: hypothetical protein PHR20_08635 [Bacteroidales bacterium]|nr:hypothetical protein [Bacteroidales bacterium]